LSRLFEALLKPITYFTRKRDSEATKEPRSILVVEYWYLGDVVMLTPFLKNLRLHYPKAHIALLASPRAIPVLQGQELVDEIISVNVPWAQHMSRWRKYLSSAWIEYVQCIAKLRGRRFDLGFTVRADVRDNFLLWVGNVGRRVGYGYGYGGSLLTDVVEPDLSRPHYCDRWLRLLEYLNKCILFRQPELKLGQEQKVFAKTFLEARGLGNGDIVIGFHAGARNSVRQWGNERFLELAKKLKSAFPVKILWFQDPGVAEPPRDAEIVPVALPLDEFLPVLSECDLLVCNDTGPMHLATAYGIPVVAVFGPGMADWWGPRSAGSRVVAHDGVWCRPCFDYCIFDEPYCLRAVSVDAVYHTAAESVRAALSRIMQGALPADEYGSSNADQAAD
jgi:heptosyltransferase-2